MGDIIGTLFILIPIFIMAFAFRWIRQIRLNSEKQIEQNNEIIALLKESKRMN
ncbi:hypothetical protein [Planococcus versutus]|uniref:hypothetical protein n=1 Tax=Planococcus versutus TaxID=1302659 RepID=UPI000ADAC0CB|nr:hypothetical protein [Planococcus versutus]